MKFNTVLVPPHSLAKVAIEFSQEHYSHDHDGYCLGSDGHLPHVTLVQTEMIDEKKIKILHNKISAINETFLYDLEFENYYHHLDRGYCGVSIHLSKEFRKLHDQVVGVHLDLGLNILNSHGQNFWPHMTFAKTPSELALNIKMPTSLQGHSSDWELQFGHMGEHGVYLGKYKS